MIQNHVEYQRLNYIHFLYSDAEIFLIAEAMYHVVGFSKDKIPIAQMLYGSYYFSYTHSDG